MGDSQGNARYWLQRVVAPIVVVIGLACFGIVLLTLFGPVIGRGLNLPGADPEYTGSLDDLGQCARAVETLPAPSIAPPVVLANWGIDPGDEPLTVERASAVEALHTLPEDDHRDLVHALQMAGADTFGDSGPLAVSPDRSMVVLIEGYPSYSAIVRVCDVATGEQITALSTDETTRAVAFTPDGSQFLVNEGRGTILVFDAESIRRSDRWNVRAGEQWRVTHNMTISPNGQIAAFSATEGDSTAQTIRLWDIAAGRELAALPGHDAGVISLRFDSTGSRLISHSLDGTLIVWGVPPG